MEMISRKPTAYLCGHWHHQNITVLSKPLGEVAGAAQGAVGTGEIIEFVLPAPEIAAT